MNASCTLFRAAVAAVLALAAGVPAAAAADAARFPVRPVRMIVASSAGTGADIYARIVAQGLTEHYREQVVVENRTGAGGLIGGGIAAAATPDGHTLFMASTSTYVSPLMQLKPPYHPIRDFTAVAQVAAITSVLLVAPAVPAKSARELVALAKAKPGDLNYGSVGAGTAGHLSAEIFRRAAGIDVVHVPFKGVAEMYTELAASRIQFIVFVLPSSIGFIRDGKVRPLAVTARTRSRSLPDVPTMAEAGVAGGESETMYGFLAPVATPRSLVQRLGTDIVTVLRRPDTRERFERAGAEPTVDTSPQAFEQYVRREYEAFRKLVPEIGLKPQ